MSADIIRLTPGGWRARRDGAFDEDNVARLAGALGLYTADRHPGSSILVGYDTREGARQYAYLAAQIMASYGLDVAISEGPCPQPALNWTAGTRDDCAGAVMVSASEAPADYDGIMVHRADGGPISSETANEISKLVSGDPVFDLGEVASADMVGPYLDALLDTIDADAIKRMAPRVVCDCMYGAARGSLKLALERSGCQVVALHEQEREDFGGLHPSCVEPWVDACERAVVSEGAVCGLVVDGDGDRAAVIDERGRLISPHVLVPIVLRHLVSYRKARGRVVATVACSKRIARSAYGLGLPMTTVPVGFSRIYDELADDDVLLACEEYGGICLPRHLKERDGLLVGLLFMECLAASGKKPSELVQTFESEVGHMDYGRRTLMLDSGEVQTFRNILPGLNPQQFANRKPVEVSHADGLKLTFDDQSWVLLRPSRFDSGIRIYAEAPSMASRDELLAAASELARRGLV